MENREIMFRVWAVSTAYSENSTWACDFCLCESMTKEWQALNSEHTHTQTKWKANKQTKNQKKFPQLKNVFTTVDEFW